MAIQRALPSTVNGDSAVVAVTPSRADQYGGAFTQPMFSGSLIAHADEGSFFTCVNATVGTGIAGHAAPVVSDADTKALLHLFNSASNTKRIYPVFLKLEFTAIGAGGTQSYNVIYTDQKGATALTSGGTAITPNNANSATSNTTGATVTFGACVTAMTSSRKQWAAACREVIPVVTDTMTIWFGSPNGSMTSALSTAGTATEHAQFFAPPIVIAPGGNFNFARIRASQSGADSYTFSFGYIER